MSYEIGLDQMDVMPAIDFAELIGGTALLEMRVRGSSGNRGSTGTSMQGDAYGAPAGIPRKSRPADATAQEIDDVRAEMKAKGLLGKFNRVIRNSDWTGTTASEVVTEAAAIAEHGNPMAGRQGNSGANGGLTKGTVYINTGGDSAPSD
jgi:hypothetical protein